MNQQASSFSEPLQTLGAGEVHVWWAALDPPRRSLPEMENLLSCDETARARRYVFDRDRLHYIAGRAFLRCLLGAYLGMDPVNIDFNYSVLGKPELKKPAADCALCFNFSNSGNRAVAAITQERAVGVDLEQVRPMPDEDDFARQFFCPSEIDLIRSQTGETKTKTFFELWTCKEALLKAMGDGLTRPINDVEVALEGGRARLVCIGGETAPVANWQFTLFQPAPGFQAALSVGSPSGCHVSFFHAEGDFDPDRMPAG